MTQKVNIYYTKGIYWPNSCASCRTNENLVTVKATSGKIASVSPIFIGVQISTDLLNLNYPVCMTHAKGLGLANLITRKTLGLSFARGSIITFGILALLILSRIILDWIKSMFTSYVFHFPDMLDIVGAFYAFCAFAFVYLLTAYKKIPVRILSQGANDVMLKFKDDVYAKEFVRLNKHCIVKKY